MDEVGVAGEPGGVGKGARPNQGPQPGGHHEHPGQDGHRDHEPTTPLPRLAGRHSPDRARPGSAAGAHAAIPPPSQSSWSSLAASSAGAATQRSWVMPAGCSPKMSPSSQWGEVALTGTAARVGKSAPGLVSRPVWRAGPGPHGDRVDLPWAISASNLLTKRCSAVELDED